MLLETTGRLTQSQGPDSEACGNNSSPDDPKFYLQFEVDFYFCLP